MFVIICFCVGVTDPKFHVFNDGFRHPSENTFPFIF